MLVKIGSEVFSTEVNDIEIIFENQKESQEIGKILYNNGEGVEKFKAHKDVFRSILPKVSEHELHVLE